MKLDRIDRLEQQDVERSERKRQVIETLAEWVRPIQWQAFAHLTFPWNPTRRPRSVTCESGSTRLNED